MQMMRTLTLRSPLLRGKDFPSPLPEGGLRGVGGYFRGIHIVSHSSH